MRICVWRGNDKKHRILKIKCYRALAGIQRKKAFALARWGTIEGSWKISVEENPQILEGDWLIPDEYYPK